MEDWQGRAACVGKHEMFEMTDRHSDFRRDIKDIQKRDTAIRSHNHSKFASALKLCATCPVLDACRESAEPEDRTWTVRAGTLPNALKKRGRPRVAELPADIADRVCSRGHVGQYRSHGAGRIRCHACKLEDQREKTGGKQKKPLDYLPGTCPKGHVDKYRKRNKPKPSGGGLLYCAECNRISRQKSRERERAAKIGA